MDEIRETDFISQLLDETFTTPCDSCNFKAECSFESKSKRCEYKYYTKLKAERIA